MKNSLRCYAQPMTRDRGAKRVWLKVPEGPATVVQGLWPVLVAYSEVRNGVAKIPPKIPPVARRYFYCDGCLRAKSPKPGSCPLYAFRALRISARLTSIMVNVCMPRAVLGRQAKTAERKSISRPFHLCCARPKETRWQQFSPMQAGVSRHTSAAVLFCFPFLPS